ncbi:CHASE domain-containing protein [Piscirickettsia litoralis]|uniref:CHASE domain-containing protein n=1 Tax=Piscirickettsia litoralis TaxID=1891921 RepID=UPI0019127CD8|nr:CHASE domain-containing protein [Piscirickettsia litoralis]
MITAKDKSSYFPVYYVNPVKGNKKAIGFDLSSSPARDRSLKKKLQLQEEVSPLTQ